MKRVLLSAVLATATLCAVPHARAQADAEEIRRLTASVEAMVEGQDSMRRQIQALKEQVDQLRAENSTLKQQLAGVGKDNVSRAELEKVVEQLREVDTKRQADAQLVQRQLKDIAELVSKPIPVPHDLPKKKEKPAESPPAGSKDDPQTALPTEGYEHVVQSGETLSVIITAYNQKYQLKVKQADVLRANPKLKDPKKIFSGQKLWIPEIK
jgi:TolA-binding protein